MQSAAASRSVIRWPLESAEGQTPGSTFTFQTALFVPGATCSGATERRSVPRCCLTVQSGVLKASIAGAEHCMLWPCNGESLRVLDVGIDSIRTVLCPPAVMPKSSARHRKSESSVATDDHLSSRGICKVEMHVGVIMLYLGTWKTHQCPSCAWLGRDVIARREHSRYLHRV